MTTTTTSAEASFSIIGDPNGHEVVVQTPTAAFQLMGAADIQQQGNIPIDMQYFEVGAKEVTGPQQDPSKEAHHHHHHQHIPLTYASTASTADYNIHQQQVILPVVSTKET